MSLINFFVPKKIPFPDSKFNKNIYLLCYFKSKTLIVDGLIESGDVMTRVWKKGLKVLIPKKFVPKKILLLGLAGGCNAHLVNKKFPKAHITAVEIDPFMIEIGKKYYKLKQVKSMDIIIADALDFVDNLKEQTQFDITMIDCFVGPDIPEKLQTPAFLKKLKNHSRYVLINRLWWYKTKRETLNFFRKISPHFFFIKTHTSSNVIISLV